MRHEVTTRRVLYEIATDPIRVRKAEFLGASGQPLPLEIYEPVTPISDGVVAIIAGYPDAGFEQRLGCKFMEMGWTISMAQLIAASGLTAVTHSNRDPESDALALMEHLASNGTKLGVWSTSGHGPVALVAARMAACAVLTNPMTRDFCPDTPLFIVRSGQDETPGLNAALDSFVNRAIADNRPVTLVNCPEAPHSFDLFYPGAETARILQQGLTFLRGRLVSTGRPAV